MITSSNKYALKSTGGSNYVQVKPSGYRFIAAVIPFGAHRQNELLNKPQDA
jgi:hypothetical protein